MEELNILEVPRILADTRYPVSDRLKLADQFSFTVVNELGPLITDMTKFINAKEPGKFSLIGTPEDAINKMFIKPSHILAIITPDDESIKDDVDAMVNEMTKTLATIIKTKNILGV